MRHVHNPDSRLPIPQSRLLETHSHRLPQSRKVSSAADLSKYDLQQTPSFLYPAPIYLESGAPVEVPRCFELLGKCAIRVRRCRRDFHSQIHRVIIPCVQSRAADMCRSPTSRCATETFQQSFDRVRRFPCEEARRPAAEESVYNSAGR
jgi:hypothetical protein